MKPRFAVVGGGVSGVAAMDGLVKAFKASDIQEATITLFEPADLVGPGRPYKVDQPYCWLLNHFAGNIGTLNGGRKGFVNWVAANRQLLSEEFATAIKRGWVAADEDGLIKADPNAFYPRNLFGMFLAACFQQIKGEAEAWGIEVVVVHATVETMSRRDDGQMIVVDGKENAHIFDQVVLASGHTYAAHASEFDTWKSYVSNVYAAHERTALMETAPVPNLGVVAIKGTGLSANDAVLWLYEQRAAGKVTFDRIMMVSRRGQLRKVRGIVGEYKMKYLTVDNLISKAKESGGHLPLDWVMSELFREMDNAYGPDDPVDWEGIWNPKTEDIQAGLAKSLREATDGLPMPWASVWFEFAKIRQAVFEHLSPEDKGRFFKEFSTIWSSYHAPMPPVSARRLLAGMEEGTLRVEAGCASIKPSVHGNQKYTLTFLQKNGRPFLTHGRNGADGELPPDVEKREVEVDTLFDALGSTVESRLFPAPYPSLLGSGLLSAHRWGGIQVDPHTFHPIKADGKPLEEVWQLGVNSQGDVLIVADAPIDIIDGKRIALSMVDNWNQKVRKDEHDATFSIEKTKGIVA